MFWSEYNEITSVSDWKANLLTNDNIWQIQSTIENIKKAIILISEYKYFVLCIHIQFKYIVFFSPQMCLWSLTLRTCNPLWYALISVQNIFIPLCAKYPLNPERRQQATHVEGKVNCNCPFVQNITCAINGAILEKIA